MNIRKKTILITIALIAVFVVVNVYIDIYMFHEKGSFFSLLFSSDPHIFFHLLIVGALFIIFGILVSLVTIERKKVREALEFERAQLLSIFNSINEVVYVTVPKTYEILYVNKTLEDLLQKHVVGSICYREFQGKESPCDFCTNDIILKEKGKPYHWEYHNPFLNRDYMIVDKIIKWPDGRDARLEIAVDITERKSAEKELKASEKNYRTILENALVGIFKSNLKGDILYMNEALAKMFEYASPEEMIGTSVLTRYKDPNDREVLIENLKKLGTVSSFEAEMLTKSGITRNMLINATRDNGEVSGMVMDITEHKQATEMIKLQLKRLNILRSIDRAIIASLDLRVTLDVLLEQIITQLDVDAASVLLLNEHTQTLEYEVSRGFRSTALKYTRLRLGESNAGRAAIERQTIIILDLKKEPDSFVSSEQFKDEDFITYCATPLIAKGQIKGVLELFHRSSRDCDPEWLEFIEAVADQAAIAIDNATLFEELQSSNVELILAYDTTIEGWSRAMDMRDKETEGHTKRVAEMTLRIAKEMGIKEKNLVHIRRGALLHDMGKMGVPDNILLKPGSLTDDEWKKMKRHPQLAYDMLHHIEYLRPALDIPYYHHERWDGTGYPKGLKREEIPLAARIFTVVDEWDALCSDRPYRLAWPKEKVLEHIRSLSGTHFDPEVVEVFLKMEW